MYSEPTTSAVRPALYRRSLPVVLLLALSFVLCLTGCSNGDSSANSSLIRTINAYIPASGADGSLTFIGNSIFLTGGNLGFGQVANGGGYISIPSGSLSASASGPTVTTAITLTGTLSGNGTAYTLLGAGEAGQTGTLAPQLVLIPNYTANQIALPAGDAAVRVVNLSLNPNPVGLYSTSSGAPSAALATGLGSVSYGYSSVNNAYVAVPTAQLANLALVDTTSTHTAFSLSSTSNLNTFTFVAGQAYTLYVIGQPGNSNEPLGVLWVVDYPTS